MDDRKLIDNLASALFFVVILPLIICINLYALGALLYTLVNFMLSNLGGCPCR